MSARKFGPFAILRQPPLTYQGRVLKEGEIFRVRVLARSEGWAMVRRRGAVPFVVEERKLLPVTEKPTNLDHPT